MKQAFTFIIILLISCTSSKKSNNKVVPYTDTYLENLQKRLIIVRDPIQIKIIRFYKNSGYCYTEGGFPYAIIVGQDSVRNRIINVFAVCNNDEYKIGERIGVKSIDDESIQLKNLIRMRKIDSIIDLKDELILGKVIK